MTLIGLIALTYSGMKMTTDFNKKNLFLFILNINYLLFGFVYCLYFCILYGLIANYHYLTIVPQLLYKRMQSNNKYKLLVEYATKYKMKEICINFIFVGDAVIFLVQTLVVYLLSKTLHIDLQEKTVDEKRPEEKNVLNDVQLQKLDAELNELLSTGMGIISQVSTSNKEEQRKNVNNFFGKMGSLFGNKKNK